MERQEFVEEVIINLVKGNEDLTGLQKATTKSYIETIVEAALKVRESHS